MSSEEQANPIHHRSDGRSTWTTTNLAEAMPGVLTPLGWSVWGDACERALRGTFCAMGVLPKGEAGVPARQEERTVSIFYGRAAARADFLCQMGDRLPGTSGTAVAEQIFNAVPAGYVPAPTRRYYPNVAVRLPPTMARAPGAVRRARAATEEWWREQIPAMETAAPDVAQRAVGEAAARFDANMRLQALAVLTVAQPVYDQLIQLLADAGDHAEALMAGYGAHEEAHMVEDLWACSRGKLTLAEFIDRHGYHGVRDGEISGVTWRENPAPLETILEGYRSLDHSGDPASRAATRVRDREEHERAFLAGLSPLRRVRARAVLSLARRYVPLRGVGKTAFLQSLDVGRAAARRLGRLLADDGLLADPEDVFFLTVAEITAGSREGIGELTRQRRDVHERYQTFEVPTLWVGTPEPQTLDPVGPDRPAAGPATAVVLSGIAASGGVAEGRVRVVTDPGETPMEPGEILVAHTTDPSWASVLFLASALVIDIGGLLSHAAVIAREMGVPCVAGAAEATATLRTGDWCRVDGSAGTVELLQRPVEAGRRPE